MSGGGGGAGVVIPLSSSDSDPIHVSYSCGSCGYGLNLNSCSCGSCINAEYGKSVKRGVLSFFSIDESRFTQINKVRWLPYLPSKKFERFVEDGSYKLRSFAVRLS